MFQRTDVRKSRLLISDQTVDLPNSAFRSYRKNPPDYGEYAASFPYRVIFIIG